MEVMELTAFDKSLLNILQSNLPICSHPFAEIAKELGTSEEIVLERIKTLKSEGYLRRIGTFFNSNALGFRGTLVALQVESDSIPRVAEVINNFPTATHNYEREGKFNLWFTLMTQDRAQEESILDEIRAIPGVDAMMNLPSNRKFKINVQFQLQ